jgi:molybdopterin converting factor subunit 1
VRAPAISVTVLYFAALRDLAGRGEQAVELSEGATVAGLLDALVARHGALGERLSSIRVAVNEEFSDVSRTLHSGDVVALIPPVSGG